MPTIPVGILGATGMVGQQFIALLADHPWFRVAWLGASQRSEGKPYREAAAWRLQAPPADGVADLTVDAATPGRARKLVFSGLDSSVAGEIEAAFAQAGHIIVSNSRNYRMDATFPLMIPEINADPRQLLEAQANAGRIDFQPVTISAQTTRVGVHNGHTVSASVGFDHQPSAEAIVEAWRSFKGRPQELDLPSAPADPIVYLSEPNRPQPTLDVDR